MTTCFYRINPLATETQKISLPTDSIVYIGMNCNSIQGLYFPQLNLLDNTALPESNPFNSPWDKTKQQFMRMSNGLPIAQVIPNRELVCNRLWTGYEPFDYTFDGILYGYNRTIDETTSTITMQFSFTGKDGNTYLMGFTSGGTIERMMPQTGNMSPDYINVAAFADVNGNLIGSAYYYQAKTVQYRFNNRLKTTFGYTLAPETIMGNLSIDVIPFDYAFVVADSFFNFNDSMGETISISQLAEPVDVSGVSTASFTMIDQPITFPMQITADERSYSYIQF